MRLPSSIGMNSLVRTAVALGAMALLTSTASAGIYTVTFTGFLTSGTDTGGVFGIAGTDLTHDAFTAAFTYNTGLGTEAGSTGVFNQLCGGSSATPYGCADNFVPTPVNGVLTIGKVSEQFLGSTYGAVQTGYEGLPGGVLSSNTIDLTGGHANYLSVEASNVDNLPTSLETTFAKTNDDNLLNFQISDGGVVTASGQAVVGNDNFRGVPGTVTIAASGSGVGPVPEPATWAMMLIGFGSLGVVGRLSRRRPATVQ